MGDGCFFAHTVEELVVANIHTRVQLVACHVSSEASDALMALDLHTAVLVSV